MDLLSHLLEPLDKGGHGHDPEGYVVAWFDWDELHEDDHYPKAWWADAITHRHPVKGLVSMGVPPPASSSHEGPPVDYDG